MHLSRGFELAFKYYPLALLAAVLDLLNLGDIGRRHVPDFHLKLTIPSALPSLTQVLQDPPGSGATWNLNLPFGYMGGVGLLLLIAFILLNAYLKGGFLGCVLEGLRERPVNREVFLDYAGRFWTRYLVQSIIVLAAVLFLGLLAMGIGPLAFVLILALLAAFFLLVFWDYSLVKDDLGVVDAAERSWRLVAAHPGPVLLFLLPVLLVVAVFSILANALAATPLVLVAVLVYAFLGTAVIFGLMSYYLELTGEGEEAGTI
jgi:hypothetical protein